MKKILTFAVFVIIFFLFVKIFTVQESEVCGTVEEISLLLEKNNDLIVFTGINVRQESVWAITTNPNTGVWMQIVIDKNGKACINEAGITDDSVPQTSFKIQVLSS